MITTKPRSTPSLFARVSVALALLSAPFIAGAQAMESAEPFKVGTFAINDIPTVGLVMRDDALVVDLNAANRAMQLLPQYSHLDMPVDMIGLIERYEYGLKYRIYEVVNWLVEEELLSGSAMRDFVYPVANVDIMAPIQYPSKIMNAAVNFYTHACEGCNDDELAQRTKERRENRGVPYLFLKPTRGAVIGDGEDIIMPYGRDEIEYEVEMAIVFGRTGKYISADRAYDHVFGYMVAMDVSDRGGRPPGGYAMRSDWFVGKGHDTFAPHGPWIVPKEFYGDPMERLHQITVVDGVTVQEAKARYDPQHPRADRIRLLADHRVPGRCDAKRHVRRHWRWSCRTRLGFWLPCRWRDYQCADRRYWHADTPSCCREKRPGRLIGLAATTS